MCSSFHYLLIKMRNKNLTCCKVRGDVVNMSCSLVERCYRLGLAKLPFKWANQDMNPNMVYHLFAKNIPIRRG
jgi:hypothetical protein